MSRTPAYLAALASSAVPGLDPVAVRAATGAPGTRCEVAFITDTQRRAWVVRVPTTSAVGAQLDDATALLGLLARRLPFGVPSPRGFVAVPEGRAVVYPYLHGRSVRLAELPPGPGVAAEIGRALAALHNVDRAVFDEAGVPVYEAEAYRTRRLADLDRAAATGHVPTALLSRWERALEDVSAWRFAPTPVHGDLTGSRVLVTFADEEDSTTATVRAITGWDQAKVADPADDLAVLLEECTGEAFESILEAYSLARIERPDRHLRRRVRLASELRLLSGLLEATTAAEPTLISRRAEQLRALDERTADQPDLLTPDHQPTGPTAGAASGVSGPVRVATNGSHLARSDGRPGPQGEDAHQPEAVDEVEERGDDTRLLRTGDAADATTVIPEDELERLRSDGASSAPDVVDSEPNTAQAAPVLDVGIDPTQRADGMLVEDGDDGKSAGGSTDSAEPTEPAGAPEPTPSTESDRADGVVESPTAKPPEVAAEASADLEKPAARRRRRSTRPSA